MTKPTLRTTRLLVTTISVAFLFTMPEIMQIAAITSKAIPPANIAVVVPLTSP